LPELLPRTVISGNAAGAQQIVTRPISAVTIICRRSEWHVDDSAIHVHRQESPDIHTRSVFPTIAFPRIVKLFSRARYRVKCPHELARVHVPRAYITRRT